MKTHSPNTKQNSLREALTLIADAMRGKEHNYTEGSMNKAIVLLAIPMVLEMGMESLFAVVDIFFVSFLGAEAVAVVGLTEAVLTLIYAIAIGFSMAVTAVIARRIGEGEHELAAITAAQVLIIGFVIFLAIAFTGIRFTEDILALMGADEEVIRQGTSYTRIMFGGSISIVYLFILAAIFRGAGNAIIAMRALLLANGINIVLDPFLIFGWWIFPELGLTGAAIVTNIGRGAGVLYLLYHLFNGKHRIQLSLRHLRFSFEESWNLIKISIGGILQFFFATASWVFLIRIVAQFGSEAIAGYTIAMRIAVFTFLPAWGLSNATATLVGQNLGANNSARAEEAVWLSAKINLGFMVSVGILLLLFAQPLIHIFTQDAQVIYIGTNTLRIIALGYACYAIGMVMTQAFNGSGDTRTPTWINFICFWMLQIPLAWIAANLWEWQTFGVAFSIPAAETVLALIAWWQFRKGKWKLTQV